MSTAAAAADPAATDATDATVTVRAGLGKKKKLLIAAIALALLLVLGGGAAFYYFKLRSPDVAEEADADAGEDSADGEQAESEPEEKSAKAEKPEKPEKSAKADVKHAPTFVPLEPFTVNLADREAERYAQVGVSLELAEPKAADLLKAYMPAIRNNILLVLGGKTSAQLMERNGKLLLAEEIRSEALRPLGYTLKFTPPAPAASGAAARKPKPAKLEDEDGDVYPIVAVHFSNFIIQ